MKISTEKITELAEKRYGTNPHSFGGQRDGFKEGFKQAQQLFLCSVIHWVALKSNIKPNEDTEECLVKYEDGKVRTALFSQEDFRFYNSTNTQEITEQIKYYSDLPK